MKIIYPVLIILILLGCASNSVQKSNIPDWYFNPRKVNDSNNLPQYIGIGSGENKDEAMVHALGDALRSIKQKKPSWVIKEIEVNGEKILESTSGNINVYEFGLITYESSFKDYERAGSLESYESTEVTSRLTLKGSNPIIIKSHLSATGLGLDAKSETIFEIIPENQDLTTLYDELAKNGINVEKNEKIGGTYYIALSIDASNPERFKHK